jgi:threonyl-tRNA synthetase
MKVPYSVIIGDNEVAENTVTVRKRSGENFGPLSVTELVGLLQEMIATKTLVI